MRKIFGIVLIFILFFTGCVFKNSTYYKVKIYDNEGKPLRIYTIKEGASMVKMPKNPTLKGSEFLGWDYTDDGAVDEIPTVVTSDMDIYPVFKKNGSIKITFLNYDESILEVVYIDIGTTPKYSKAIPFKESSIDKVFTFDGWDKEVGVCTSDTTFIAKFTEEVRSYTYKYYDSLGNILLEKNDKYGSEIVILDPVTKDSDKTYTYEFSKWVVKDNESKIVTILDNDYEFIPKFKSIFIEYKINFYKDEFLISSNNYHYGDLIEIPVMEYEKIDDKYFGFVGWDKNNDNLPDEVLNCEENANFKAIYKDTQLVILHIGEDVKVIYVSANDDIDLSSFKAQHGYKYVWYKDYDYKNELLDYKMITGNLELYAKEEVLVNLNTSVLDYEIKDKVESREELQTYFNYLIFNNINSSKVTLDYSFSDYSEEIGSLTKNCNIDENYSVNTSYVPFSKQLTLTISYSEKGTISSTPIYTEINSLCTINATSTRTKDYKLYIDGVTKTHEVNTSDQLYYVLECGYKPIIKNTKLNNLYEKMRKVLIENINDDMNDYEKVTVIYEWLINNVIYDGIVLDKVINGEEDVFKYRCFYLEGVFNDGLAVCDGISKALACLCNMEGIPAVKVSGIGTDSNINHAWNKVLINNEWLLVDATSGGTIVGNNEILTHRFLFITDDDYKKYYKETINPDKNFSCKYEYNYYEHYIINYEGKELDLVCDDMKEFVALFNAFDEIGNANDMFEVYLKFDFGDSVSDEVQIALDQVGIGKKISYMNEGKVVMIIFK